MFRSRWSKLFRTRSSRPRTAPARRPLRLEALEDRLAPATLDVTGGALTYTAGNGVSNNLTVSLKTLVYTFSDSENITLTPNAIAAGFVAVGGTATGPSTSVTTSIKINLKDGTDTLTLGTFDAALPSLTANDGAQTGDTATIAAGGSGLVVHGTLTLNNFDVINVNNAVTVTNAGTGDVAFRATTSVTSTAAGTTVSDGNLSWYVGPGGNVSLGANVTAASDRFGNPTVGAMTTTTITNPITINGGALGIAFMNSMVSTGTNNLTLIGDNMAYVGITGSGNTLQVMPFTPNRPVVVSDNPPTVPPPPPTTLSLPTALVNALTGFGTLVFGSATDTGNLTLLNPFTTTSAVTLEEGGAGGTLTLNGHLTVTTAAPITVLGSGAGTTLNDDITTSGGTISIQDKVILGAAGTSNVDTTNGGAVPAGATIQFGNTLDDDASPTALTLTAGSAGDVTFGGAVGGSVALASLTINGAHDVIFAGTVQTTGAVTETGGTGTTTLSGSSGAGVAGGLSVTANAITLGSASLTVGGTVLLTATAGITLDAGLNAGTNAVALTGDPITLNATLTGGSVALIESGTTGVSEGASGVISAAGLLVVDQGASGTVLLTGNNAVATLAGNIHSAFTFINSVPLTVGQVNATPGMNTNDNDLTLQVTGLLTLGDGSSTTENMLAVGANTTVTAAGVTESVNATVLTRHLALQGTGAFSLSQANQVNILAANVTGALAFTNARQLIVGQAGGLNGISTNGNGLTLTVSGGLLALGDATATQENVTASTVDILTTGLYENDNAIITASGLRLQGLVGFVVNTANLVGTLAANVTAPLNFTNAQALTVGSVLGTNGITGTNVGLDTTAGVLTLGDGSGTAQNVLANNGGLFVDAAGLTQSANSTVTAFAVILQGTGTFSLAGANLAFYLAADVTGALSYNNNQALITGVFGSVAGVNTGGNDLTLAVSGGLLAIGDATLTPAGLTAAGATIDINSSGIFQNGNGAITAGSLRLRGDTGFQLSQTNAVGTLAADVTGGLAFNATQALTLGTVNGTTGINAHGSNVSLNATAGLTEAAGATVSAGTLVVSGTGTFALTQANTVTTLTANVAGPLSFSNNQGLVAAGLNTGTGNNLVLTVNGLLALGDATASPQNVTATGATVDVTASGVFENANATVMAGSLRLQGGTSSQGFTLTGNNAVGTLAAAITNSLAFTDTQTLTVGSVLGTTGVVTTAGDVVFTADTMSLGAPVQGTGILFLLTLTPSRNILIASANPDPNALNLGQSDINNIVGHNGGQNPNGFTVVAIGLPTDSGTITVANPVNFSTSVQLRTSGTVSGASNVTVPNGDTVTTS